MCGIAAIHLSQCDTLKLRLEVALASMRHRGPDGEGIWLSKSQSTGLGSVRLAVVGVEDGRQPITNEAGNITAVVNGEFYDWEHSRCNLQARGHVFTTQSDSELLVHLYEEHGLECLRHLRGEFAFLLWDETKNRLLAACDRFGIKPLHVVQRGAEWLFASEIKALISMGIQPRWDVATFHHVLAHQYARPGETLFSGVRQLRPAQALVIENGFLREFCYWQPSFKSDASITAPEVRASLEEAVRLRMRSDVPVACTLSGGLDSSAVAAVSGLRDCFCVRFDSADYDEGPQVLADAAAHQRVHEVPVTRRDLVTHLSAAVHQSEGLAINGQLVGKYLLSRAIRNAGFKVVLAGEGADEAFLGYAHLQEDAGFDSHFRLQRGVMLPAKNENAPWSTPAWLERLPTFLRAKMATGRRFATLIREPLDSQQVLNGTLEEIGPVSGPFVRQSAWLWTRTALAGYILRTLGDGAEMAHSVEARLPFLDHVLFEMAARIPVKSLIDQQNTKLLLREALCNVVPKNVRTRQKHPFLSPPLESDPMVREFIRDTLHSDSCRDLPLFEHSAVVAWSDALDTMPSSFRAQLDPVLMLILTATLLNQTYSLS